jgi:hypothetical protein
MLWSKPKGKAFGNKTNAKSWQRKNNEPTKEVEKKEMNSIMKKQIRQHIRKEIAAISKKKGDSDQYMLDVVLKDFNYAEVDNMNIDSDYESDSDRGCIIDKDLEFDSDEVSV